MKVFNKAVFYTLALVLLKIFVPLLCSFHRHNDYVLYMCKLKCQTYDSLSVNTFTSLEGRFDDKELQDMLDEINTYRSIQS